MEIVFSWVKQLLKKTSVTFFDVLLFIILIYDLLPNEIKYKVIKFPYWLNFYLDLIDYLGEKIYSNGFGLYFPIIIVFICWILDKIFEFFKIERTLSSLALQNILLLFWRFLWITYFFVKELLSPGPKQNFISPVKQLFIQKISWNYNYPKIEFFDKECNCILLILNVAILFFNVFNYLFPKYDDNF